MRISFISVLLFSNLLTYGQEEIKVKNNFINIGVNFKPLLYINDHSPIVIIGNTPGTLLNPGNYLKTPTVNVGVNFLIWKKAKIYFSTNVYFKYVNIGYQTHIRPDSITPNVRLKDDYSLVNDRVFTMQKEFNINDKCKYFLGLGWGRMSNHTDYTIQTYSKFYIDSVNYVEQYWTMSHNLKYSSLTLTNSLRLKDKYHFKMNIYFTEKTNFISKASFAMCEFGLDYIFKFK